MMTQREIREWREQERERLNALYLSVPKELCRNTINTLTAVLQDD